MIYPIAVHQGILSLKVREKNFINSPGMDIRVSVYIVQCIYLWRIYSEVGMWDEKMSNI